MIHLPGTPHHLLQTLRKRIIPWMEGGAPLMLMDAPPRPTGSIIVRPVAGNPLKVKRGWGSVVREQFWLEENLNAMTVPYMGCVLEGAADIVVGTTTAMNSRKSLSANRWVASFEAGQFFIAPPGVPISAGGKVHWEGTNSESAHSLIAWFQIHLTGVSFHACSCENGEHRGTGYLAIRNERFMALMENVIVQLRARNTHSLPLAYHYLSILFHHMAQSLEDNYCAATESATTNPNLRPDVVLHAPLLDRALEYIDTKLGDPVLNVAAIATHTQVSATHLNRIFRAELNTSVKKYVADKRHQTACRMLRDTSYNIRQISIYCGYGHVSSFIKSFSSRENMPPLRYRNNRNKTANERKR